MTADGHFRWALAAFALWPVWALAGGTGVGDGYLDPTPGQAGSKDKGGYTIFNPVPANLLRELSPDRPDKTESPYTVDAGHFQVEMDFANFTLDESAGVRTRAWNVAPFNVKIGLLNNLDLQFVFDDFFWVRAHGGTARTTTTQSGMGDLTTA